MFRTVIWASKYPPPPDQNTEFSAMLANTDKKKKNCNVGKLAKILANVGAAYNKL